ncbi:acyl-CoA dehydrogenase family protein [Aldersonia sp. NBC_00410]|uniref:acyl-CoA dehydrogenase family protein n=1 Tax=Aldersonia sp. NBC_00410 TaxID=2975954 RepID=UPI00225223AC|nr:acyl-CoA dehydrogenase family protein [Aldersonia sp. NBC_00410]MCX5044246.1 acyl-CoA dehydrogenase family protein [Aldersonia sp. NBC_00410]
MTAAEMESVESFRARAGSWLKANMPPAPAHIDATRREWDRARELQRRLYDGGFAGICFPKEYGGLGLTPAHQRAFSDESLSYDMPLEFNVPTLAVCAPTILDMGTEEQKRRHIHAALRGDEFLAQFLSEPRGGSDLAGLTTKAVLDGDRWILNGAKIWSSGAYAASYALCLARTNWEVAKHRGLTMFLVPTDAEGLTIQQIKQADGTIEFCQEFFDDVVLPADAVVGQVDGGWDVASRQLVHERSAVGGASPYASGAQIHSGGDISRLVALARRTGQMDDIRVREDIGEARAMSLVLDEVIARITGAIGSGSMPPPAGSIIRLLSAENSWLQADMAVRISGSNGATEGIADEGEPGWIGRDYLHRQAWSLAGGSTEMARNIISERVLGMPREFAADRDVPFNQVKHGR